MNLAFHQLSVAQLRALAAMLEVRNLSRAAKLLGASQPALSRHLAQFREALGDPLMVRRGREYVLTERGQALLEPLREVLTGLERLSSPSEFSPASCERRFCLAGSDYVAQYILPGLLHDLALQAPGVSVEFRIWQADRYDWLEDGKVDLVTSMLEETPADYHGRVLGEDAPVCCMSAAHPLARQERISQAQYLAWPHVMISMGGDKDSFVDAHLRRQHLRRNLKLSVPFYSAALSVIQQSEMLLTLPEHIARQWSQQAAVCARPLSFIEHRFRYWMVWHSRIQRSPEQQWFRQFVFEHCRNSPFLSPGDAVPPGYAI
ncbi:LysR substrate-binding domain-containing protein [Kerstersia sp.]|uniref:LysR substrate-binding domain-containing protein n=1 Tax=Kerstersia sp. TaxID=1930783 RepID=UPI003F90FA5F